MAIDSSLVLIGRVVLGLFFVIAGVRNFLRFQERIAMPTNYGWKLPPVIIALGFAVQFLGGLSVALNVVTTAGAAVLILFLICATALFHNFFMFKGEERQPHLYFTLVNCALIGYCLIVIGVT